MQKAKHTHRRNAKFLARDEILGLARDAREALFPSHDSEIGFARNAPHIVHGVVSAQAISTQIEPRQQGASPPLFYRRRQRSTHKAGIRFREPSLQKTRNLSPGRESSTLGKRKQQKLTIALPIAASGSADADQRRGGARRGSMSARGVAGEGGVQPTPTSALTATLNRALRLKGTDFGPASPISKSTARKSPKTATIHVTAHTTSRQDVYRYLGDLASSHGDAVGGDQFLLDAYGIDRGGFVAGADVTPDAARVLGKVLGFAGDLIQPCSLLAQACFACGNFQQGSDSGDVKGKGTQAWSSLAAPAAALAGRGSKLRLHLDVWERELKLLLQKACGELERMVEDLHAWPTWYHDLSEFDRKTVCASLAACDRDFRTTFHSLASGSSDEITSLRGFTGFMGKAPGLGGQPLSESDMHKLMNDELLSAAVEACFSDLLKEAVARVARLAAAGGAADVLAPFPFLRRCDWGALLKVGPAIEAVRKEMHDSRRRLQMLAARAGATKAVDNNSKQAGKAMDRWGKGKAKMMPMMKLGLMAGEGKSEGGSGGGARGREAGGGMAKMLLASAGPESLLACTLKASLSDGVKLAASACWGGSGDGVGGWGGGDRVRSKGVKDCEAALARRGALPLESAHEHDKVRAAMACLNV